MNRYFYSRSIEEFISGNEDEIIGELSTGHLQQHSSLESTQSESWREEIAVLRHTLYPYIGRGSIFFEYSIPRMGRRIDVVVLIDGIIFLLEFKSFNDQYIHSGISQVWDYALDLKNFHEESHNRNIVPILISTEAESVINNFSPYDVLLFYPLLGNNSTLGDRSEERRVGKECRSRWSPY